MGEHTFHFEGTWDGGYKGKGQITVGNLSTVISRAKSMDGLGEGTNPDEMLIGAAGSCFLMSLTYILDKGRIPVERLTVSSTGTFYDDKDGVHFERLVHHPHIVLSKETGVNADKVHKFIKLAEDRCMVSNAFRGNVDVIVKPTIEII
ncbi:OsmC family protein [Neobacillus sp. C211]|jgi:peroxiredoxin-like protein|uniref:OsmC family protein n=1 Tax=Bacillaceae TaxID=186817 RepID=UPI001BEB4F40|nr:OsmC family protein [Bacillus sp. ISL-7]MBT2738557.1 OsmC family protein [Bacillus sp. ISL-7]